ncbi:MAG: elongation factor P [Candidatus Levybacteria bacterium RIFCSPHIGHO2_02_FULL_40_18]|nr:MAG: elongation factor P [Candidatus Levybacteria bacterium RIFCSPHIGHO2_01_FULL_40_58]OGH26768.1 MAG: elongation factor P [Candidatus Levybacteria bacterium RIFCSPHIGHO2_02_FULL_40_18]OGH31703.1 MAG: elongation factor P [Candidatus Levybacteria bacterium RIFCSPHIGHO2_12_FULL_40_31]OGH40603.1 MAG: elongation factor P [Candidatus Levybacteria bacterium RIFCSPLOWO2_01_FULL_40_64]OGH48776.1 MAG: elongation factor P [Candidatus Levybacteria bacterium RIFCSPLOWO2_02_FULL_41_11]OGH53322.1 MAG: el
MISVNDLRAGATFEENGDIFKVLAFEHIKMGRGSANIKVKVKNLRNGSIIEKGYTNGANVSDIILTKREFQFLYKDSENAYFMDPRTFEQRSIPLKTLSGSEYLKEGETVSLEFFEDEALDLLLPPKITLRVSDTTPGVRGDSATNIYKDAILENGGKIKVPLFIKVGDSIVVDTRDGSYTKRA